MGMYSSFSNEDITVKDLKGLKEFIKLWKAHLKKIGGEYDWNIWDIVTGGTKGTRNLPEEVTFEKWDNIKLISYWYTEQCVFLHLVGKYIRGTVEWEYENKDEAGYVEFTDEGTVIHTGQMDWNEWKPLDLMKGHRKEEVEQFSDLLIADAL